MATGAQQAQRATRGVYHNPWDNLFLVTYLEVQPNEGIQADTLRIFERNGRIYASEQMPSIINAHDKPDIEVVGYYYDPRFLIPSVPRRIEDIKERYHQKATQLPPGAYRSTDGRVPYRFDRTQPGEEYAEPAPERARPREIRRRDARLRSRPIPYDPNDPQLVEESSTSFFESDLEYYPIAQR
jgi:hypothetical protein